MSTERNPLRLIGVDGCPGGWVLARVLTLSPERGGTGLRRVRVLGADVTIVRRLDAVVDELRQGAVDAMAVDMPIGLLEHHPRPADTEARRRLGPRRSSVFPTPVRAALPPPDGPDLDPREANRSANARSRAAAGVGLSKQAFNLIPKIAELDRLIEPADQDRLVEAHPELAFARLAGHPLAHTKRSPEGALTRRRLLAGVFGDRLLRNLLHERSAPENDVLDALVLVTVADRVAQGTEERLGSCIDPTNKRAELVV